MMLRYTYLMSLFLMPFAMAAQDLSALDYFNRAAKEYVKQDKLTALRTLDEALRHHPGDPRLLKLAEELLKEEQQQQQQEQQKQEQNNKQEQEQDQQQEQNENKEKRDNEKENEGSEEKDRKENEKKEEGSQDSKPGEEQPLEQKAAGKIDPQDARRILDALDRQEKDVQEKIRAQQRPANRIPIEKDW